MRLKYNDEDIEFANRILNHREELEDSEVKVWLGLQENRVLLDELAGMKMLLGKRDFRSIKANELNRLRKTISKQKVHFPTWWMSAAAAVVFFIGVGLWLWQQEPEIRMTENTGQGLEISPGTNRAELVLASGRSVILGKDYSRIDDRTVSGIVNDSVNGLNYTQVAVRDNQETMQFNTLKIPAGGFYKLELPDGTKVWLNAASELKFPVQFGQQKREVYLKGEGYFEVTKDTARQFVVHLKNSQVTVLGTVFNINAYENEQRILTTLVEGSVRFSSEKNNQEIILRPGFQSVMETNTGHTSVNQVEVGDYTAWVEGRFVFRAMDLDAIIRQLQRWYGFEVFYQNQEVRKYEFRGMISRDMDIRQVLSMIERATDVHFDIKGKTIVIRK